MLITAVILTKNSSETLNKCLASLNWCDERIVIDDNSKDKTVDIAKSLGAKVFIHSLENDFSQQRNFGLEKAEEEWVFFVDADEFVSKELAEEIRHKILRKVDGFYIKRSDYLFGKQLKFGESGNIWLLRLGKKNNGKWQGKVHEAWQLKGHIEKLENTLTHFPHENISSFLQKINFYTTLRAQELFEKRVKIVWWDIIFYPKAKFIQDYFLKLGFLDGVEGFIAAVIMSFHSFLVRGKLWQLQNKTS